MIPLFARPPGQWKLSRWRVSAAGLAAIALIYVAGAFVVTPPYSGEGIFTSPIKCSCGYRSFYVIEGGRLYRYWTGHNVRELIGQVVNEEVSYTMPASANLPALRLHAVLGGVVVVNLLDGRNSFLPRDYLYPTALWTMRQTRLGNVH